VSYSRKLTFQVGGSNSRAALHGGFNSHSLKLQWTYVNTVAAVERAYTQ
jgi:hypothetical protein